MAFRSTITPMAMLGLALTLACGTEPASTSNVDVAFPPVATLPVAAPADPGEVEIVVAESIVSVTPYKLGEGELFLSAPSDYYEPYDWETSPTTERPAFLDGVVQHRTLSPNVGIRGLSNTTTAPRGGGEKSLGISSSWLWSQDADATPIGATQPFPLSDADEVSLEVGQEFIPYLLFGTHSAFEGTVLVTAIVDYEQVEFEMDGISGLLHEFKTLPGRMLAIPINFGSFGPGAHDIEVIAINDPYRGYGRDDGEMAIRSMNDYDRYNVLSIHPLAYRTRVVVGGDETPARAFSIDGVVGPPPPDIQLGRPAYFAQSGASRPWGAESDLRVGEGEAGEEYNFSTWSSRWDSIGDGTQVLMLFMDYKMIPFNGDTVHFADLAAGEMISIDTTIALPDEPGDHQLIGMVMYEPYRSMVDARFEKFETSNQKLVINAR
ncbi:MAG: hypothetical protein HQ478_05455 [Chloroflexi bacterium]|nr:hypothetical protein [Chloroflexota bacterium]